jgi:hypothetical protein
METIILLVPGSTMTYPVSFADENLPVKLGGHHVHSIELDIYVDPRILSLRR